MTSQIHDPLWSNGSLMHVKSFRDLLLEPACTACPCPFSSSRTVFLPSKLVMLRGSTGIAQGPGVKLVHFDVTLICYPIPRILAQPHLIPTYNFPSLNSLLSILLCSVIQSRLSAPFMWPAEGVTSLSPSHLILSVSE